MDSYGVKDVTAAGSHFGGRSEAKARSTCPDYKKAGAT